MLISSRSFFTISKAALNKLVLPGGKKDQHQTEESFQKGPILCHLVIDPKNEAELRVFDPERVSWTVADVPSEKSLIDLPMISIAPPTR